MLTTDHFRVSNSVAFSRLTVLFSLCLYLAPKPSVLDASREWNVRPACFCVGLVLLRMVPMRFSHTVAGIRASFLCGQIAFCRVGISQLGK